MSDDLRGPPPPGPIQPIFNDSVTQLERERRNIRRIAEAITPPEARELVKSSAAAFNQREPLPGSEKKHLRRAPAPQRQRQSLQQQQPRKGAVPVALSPTKSVATSQTQTGDQSLQNQITNLQAKLTALQNQLKKPTPPMSNLIQPVNAQGQPIADPSPAPPTDAPKLVFNPAPDGTFVKIVDRQRPVNHPAELQWTQKYVTTHDNNPFAIARDKFCADLIAQAINVYFNAMLQQQAEAAAAKAACEAAQSDANAFDGLPAGADVEQEVDAITGEPIPQDEIEPTEELPSV
jgi:hypothetical protein